MKRIFSFGMMLVGSVLAVLAQFNGGSGTKDDPYLIRRPAQLANLSTILGQQNVFVKLQSDIDLSGYLEDEEFSTEGWVPIGTSAQPFKGTFIGNGKKIKGLFVANTTDYIGFFGSLDGATINDLTIEATDMSGSSYIGVMAGYAKNCNISNCHVKISGAIDSPSGSYVGGFIGAASNCNMSNCSIEGTINSSKGNHVGGLIGRAMDGTQAVDTRAAVTMTGGGSFWGGMFGTTNTVTVANCQVIGNITGVSCIGGIIGKAEGTDILANVSYTGDVAGQTDVAGISAYLASGSSAFTSCLFKGTITATGDYAGGIVGSSQGVCIATMEDCCNYGDINAGSYAGGLIGAVLPTQASVPTLYSYTIRVTRTNGNIETQHLASDGWEGSTYTPYFIRNNMVSGHIIGNDNVGGLLGYDASSVRYSSKQYWTETTGSYPSNYAKKIELLKNGVVVGTYSPSSQIKVYWYKYTRYATSMSLTDNYCYGEVKGKNNVGGLVGYKAGGDITCNYTCLSVSGEDNVGGLVGYLSTGSSDAAAYKTTMASNIAINSAVCSGSTNYGRIYGLKNNNNVTIPGLDSDISNRVLGTTRMVVKGISQMTSDDLRNGASATSVDLVSKSNYETWGWDFENNWDILDGESYPYKKYQTAPPSIKYGLVSESTFLSGKSANNGTIFLVLDNQTPITTTCNGENWRADFEPLLSGTTVTIYAETDDLAPSYPQTFIVCPQGTGTEEDPYRLYTADDLQGIHNSGYYRIMNDIDLTKWISSQDATEGWRPIGKQGVGTIHLDGSNHRIRGLWTNTTGTYNGLFACLPNGGSVKDLSIEVAAGKKVQGGYFAGILAGYAVNTTAKGCLVNGGVEASSYAGGLIGYTDGGSVSECCSKGNIKATTDEGYAGGLVAYCCAPVVNSYSSANVEASECAAGLVGFSSSTIDKCYARGDVIGRHFGAGLVAFLSSETAAVTNSAALNETITMSDEYASASRIINSNINGCPDPDDSNIALNSMVVKLNNKVEKVFDDEWEGTGKPIEELLQSATYEALGWDFTSIWGIIENETPPYLFYEIRQGDVNHDGQVDMTDAISIVYYYLGERPSIFMEDLADMNADGRIDLTDAIIIVYQYLGEGGNSVNAKKILEKAMGNEH